MAITAPVRDGVVVVAGIARAHATVPPTAPKPSAQLAPGEMWESTSPTTRSAGFVGFFVFQASKVAARGPFRDSKFEPVPQNCPFVITERMSSRDGLIVYRRPAVPPRSLVPAGSGKTRDTVVIPFTAAVRAAAENWES